MSLKTSMHLICWRWGYTSVLWILKLNLFGSWSTKIYQFQGKRLCLFFCFISHFCLISICLLYLKLKMNIYVFILVFCWPTNNKISDLLSISYLRFCNCRSLTDQYYTFSFVYIFVFLHSCTSSPLVILNLSNSRLKQFEDVVLVHVFSSLILSVFFHKWAFDSYSTCMSKPAVLYVNKDSICCSN